MSGPYVVTTKRECPDCWGGRPKWAGTMPTGPCSTCQGTSVLVSRAAVTSLDDARYAIGIQAGGAVALAMAPSLIVEIASMIPEFGDTITLPDGTVIEVEQTTWQVLAEEADLPYAAGAAHLADSGHAPTQQRILDTFNTQEARR